MPVPSDLVIRDVVSADAAEIAKIYGLYIETSTATFEVDPIGVETMTTRMAEVTERGYPWLVAEVAGRLVGFAYAGPFRPRAAYSMTIETTIYLAASMTRQGVGRALYEQLLTRVRTLGFHVAMATIALPNDASVALHESIGFTRVATLPEVGYKFDGWIDVGYWHLRLE